MSNSPRRRRGPSEPRSSASSDDAMLFDGEVVEALPNACFKVRLDGVTLTVLAHISGKMRVHRIRILPGDRVRVEVSSYDLTRGRIIFRENTRPTG